MSVKRTVRGLATVALLATLAAASILAGCSSKTTLGGAEVPNALPDTRITATPPTLRDAVFIVHFFWSGSDPDGKIRGFQWKISDNGINGIGLRDTLTIDPATGDTLHPWHSTMVTDSTFIVTADIPNFPNDRQNTDPRDRRSYQTHTIFVRSIDDQGGADPTPAMVSFTSTTIAPTIIVDRPANLTSYKTAKDAPPTLTFGWSGSDPDFDVGVPTKVRYLWKKAVLPSGDYCDTEYAYKQNLEYLCSFSDSAWSDWMPYKPKPEDRMVTFRNQQKDDSRGRHIAYLFAIQAQDTAGAVNPDRTYALNVHNLVISQIMTPALTVRENYLGAVSGTALVGAGVFDIAQNQPLNFSWDATADTYAGIVVSYRYGWDVADPTNENDPGWALQAGDSPQHHKSPERSFSSGTHTLTVQAIDNSAQLTRVTIILNVVPVPAPGDQLPLLVVDDVYDSNSNGWPGTDGRQYDRDVFRDAFWLNAVTGSGGVSGFVASRDVVDLEVNRVFSYRDVVNYRSLIWEEKKASQSYVDATFDPRGGDKFVWLGTYQQQVGHVLLAGQQALNSFLGDNGMLVTPPGAEWMSPIIMDTNETYKEYGNPVATRYALGSGERVLGDGTRVLVGKTRYPYSAWGVDMIDHTSSRYFIWPGGYRGTEARRSNCSGLKALVLDPNFKAAHFLGGVIADTIMTWRTLETTADNYPAYPHFPNLRKTFVWNLDEFYDKNVTQRDTPWAPVELTDRTPAVEPMFRLMTRYEWIRGIHVARGDAMWPLQTISPDTVAAPWDYDKYTVDKLRLTCGSGTAGLGALFDLNNPPRTKLDGAPVGLLSHKTELTKPTPGGDVLWGFDPSRFEPDKIRKAIQWVLGEEFHLRMVSP